MCNPPSLDAIRACLGDIFLDCGNILEMVRFGEEGSHDRGARAQSGVAGDGIGASTTLEGGRER